MTCRLTGLALLLLLLPIAGCGPRHEAAREAATRAEPGGAADTAAAAGPSLFELGFPLIDSDGRTRHLGELRGRSFVASMVYTSCTSVCPRITADLLRLERALPGEVRARTRFVLFSLDPARDTPAAMRSFVRQHGLDSTRWTMLAAGPDDMRTLAAVLDVRFRPDPQGEIAHSAVILVVGADGVIRHRQAGLGAEPSALVAAVREAQ